MGFLWRTNPQLVEPDASACGVDRVFDDQASAEAWLTATYEELDDLGVVDVTLYEDDRCVYGPMPLSQ